jgi:hypothetical protein
MTQMVTLQLDVKAAVEDVVEPGEIVQSAAVLRAVVDEAVGTACEAHQPAGVLFYVFAGREMFAFLMPEFHGGNHPCEVLVTAAIHRDERQETAVFHRDLSSDDRLYALLLRLEMEPDRSGHRVAVHQSCA